MTRCLSSSFADATITVSVGRRRRLDRPHEQVSSFLDARFGNRECKQKTLLARPHDQVLAARFNDRECK